MRIAKLDRDTYNKIRHIVRLTTSFSGLANPFVQTFKYDSLYRLTEAKEKSGTNENWKELFSYDRYGNRLSYEKYLNGTQLTLDNKTHPSINPQTNRFNTDQGYTYDLNGNLIADAEGRNFTFNGDNKQSEIRNGTTLLARYFYDGEGKRVKKKVYNPTETVKEETVFVYDGLGKLIAEYSTATPPQNPTTSYTATDMLGSPRVITDSQGNVTSRRDFMPFGEELANDPNHRTAALKYNTGDSIRQKFTGYQKDEETNLDFAEARMYENRHARFTAVDPLLASGKSANPQTFNRYVYVMNNPLLFIDPTGLQAATHVGTVWTDGTMYGREEFEGSYRYEGDSHYVDATDGYTYVVSSGGFYALNKTADINARAQSWGEADSQRRLDAFFGSIIPTTWIPEWQIDPPGYEEASRPSLGGRDTITDNGETNYDQFLYQDNLNRTMGLLTATQTINLGLPRNPPNVTPVSRSSASGVTLFSNLYPKDTPRPVTIRELSFDGNKWRATGANGTTITPNGRYNFVVQNDSIFISRLKISGAGGHVDLSRGNPVQFAGEIRFGHGNNAGNLRFWNNASGHFKPPANFSNQAPLPPPLFRPIQF